MRDSLSIRPFSLAFLVATSALLIALALGAGYLGHLHPALDSFSHFRVHLASLLIAVGALAAIFRMFTPGSMAMAAGIAAIWFTLGGLGPLAPGGLQSEPVHANPADATYRLLHVNLRFDNATPERVISLIGRTRPDIIALTEVSAMWRQRLQTIAHAYPHQIVCQEPTPIGGVAILSRRPFLEPEPACHDRGSIARAGIDLSGRRVEVVALHLGWPWPFNRPHQIPFAAGLLAELGGDAIVAGDFNVVPWSAAAARLKQAGRLRLASGHAPTWLFLGLPDLARRHLGLPIDQVLVRGRVQPLSAERRQDVGSDHLPILFEFSLPKPEPDPDMLQAVAQAGR